MTVKVCKLCCDESIPRKNRMIASIITGFVILSIITGISILIYYLTLPPESIEPNVITVNTNGTQFTTERMNITLNGTNGTEIISVTELIELTGEPISYTYVWYVDDDDNQYGASGADVVEYFSLSSSDNSVEGNELYQTVFEGIAWKFKDETNLNLFINNPTNYAPRYGGYCAYAMASGYYYSGDPDAWTVHEGYLYINANKNVRNNWSNNKNANIEDADDNWGTGEFENDNWDNDLEA